MFIVGSEDADTMSLAQRGNMIRARYATVGQQDDDAKKPIKSKVFAYRVFAFGFTLVVGTLAALYFSGALMVAVN